MSVLKLTRAMFHEWGPDLKLDYDYWVNYPGDEHYFLLDDVKRMSDNEKLFWMHRIDRYVSLKSDIGLVPIAIYFLRADPEFHAKYHFLF